LNEPKYIDIKEFKELGMLQEANRLFFHPLGLALAVTTDEDGRTSLFGIIDVRDDPEGYLYSEAYCQSEKAKENKIRVAELMDEKFAYRLKKYGFTIQPIDN
jgi:hypothetical protein